MTPGDLYWVEFPAGAGRAQAGRRPAVIVQSASATSRLPTVLMVPLTTQHDALRFPGTVLVEADATNGLRRASVALGFQMTAIDKQFLSGRLGRISEVVRQQLWTAIDEITSR